MTIQFIKQNGRKAFAVMPYSQFLQMKEKLADYKDLIALDKAKANLANQGSRPFVEFNRERGYLK